MNLPFCAAQADILKKLLRWQANLLGGAGRQKFLEG